VAWTITSAIPPAGKLCYANPARDGVTGPGTHENGWCELARDIEQVIEQVKQQLPDVKADQLAPTHPGADEDGLWFFRMPGTDHEIAIESPTGQSPFTIEHDDMSGPGEAETANTVDEAVEKVVTYLSARSA